MAQCNHCGDYVSNRFEKVFSDNEGNIHACQSCSAQAGIAETSMSRREEEIQIEEIKVHKHNYPTI